MITGFNTDIKHNSRVYHIQTEDKGLQNPYIESLVYVGGEILASKKTSYADLVKQGGIDEKAVSRLMEQQHKTVIAAVRRGRFDEITDAKAGNAIAASLQTRAQDEPVPVPQPAPAAAPAAAPAPGDERTLDQVIIDYLASQAESEHLRLELLNDIEFISGQPVEVRIATRKSISHHPIAAASVEVKVISTVDAPRVIFRGKTGGDGVATVRCTIPSFHEGTAAVIISAQSPFGNDEVKQLVKRRK